MVLWFSVSVLACVFCESVEYWCPRADLNFLKQATREGGVTGESVSLHQPYKSAHCEKLTHTNKSK